VSEILERYGRVVLWGLTDGYDSFRHIHRHFAHALERLGKEYAWADDVEENRVLIRPGDLVFAVDVASHNLGLPVAGASYVLHNFSAGHDVWHGIDHSDVLRLQVYTSAAEAYGVEWEPGRRYDRAARTLFQPWGTDLLVDEFNAPVFRGESREVPFVGTIWEGDGQGNVHAIKELREIVDAHRLVFRHLVHVSDEANVAAVRTARIAPAVAGAWQVEQDYLPCRVFKNVSYGALAVTNVPKFRELFAGCFAGRGSIGQIVTEVLGLSAAEYLELVHAQQAVVSRYTYRQSLEAIDRALEEGR
jgi:hypothetical protein